MLMLRFANAVFMMMAADDDEVSVSCCCKSVLLYENYRGLHYSGQSSFYEASSTKKWKSGKQRASKRFSSVKIHSRCIVRDGGAVCEQQ